MPTNSYDLIVMGTEPAGLVAATLCARRGMRVLLARTTRHRTDYQLGPYTLPARALPIAGMANPAISRVLEELHFDHTLKRKLRQESPSFQLVAPDARIDVTADDVAVQRELERELGDATGALAAFTGADSISDQLDGVLGLDATFPPTGFWTRREVGRSESGIADEAAGWLDGLSDDALARALVELPAALTCRTNPLALRPEACARAFSLWRRGTPRLAGDWTALEELFLDKLSNHSGEVRDVRIAEVTFSWGKASGVRLESGEELGADQIIAAMPVAELDELVAAKRPKRLAQVTDKIAPAGYRYVLNLLVGEAGVPAGMARTVLFLADPEQPLIGDNALAIYVSEPDSEARVVITVEATCPAPDDGQPLTDLFADLRVRIRERLEQVMPFVGEHIFLAHSPLEPIPAEGVEGVLELARPLAPLPLWSSSLESHLGLSAVPYDVGIKRLTVASSQVLCGLGLEGDFAAGWGAAKLASAGTSKRRDIAKDELLAAKR